MIIEFADVKNGCQKRFPVSDVCEIGRKATDMDGCVVTMTGDLFDKYSLDLVLIIERECGGKVYEKHCMFYGSYNDCLERYNDIRRALENGDSKYCMTYDDYRDSRSVI